MVCLLLGVVNACRLPEVWYYARSKWHQIVHSRKRWFRAVVSARVRKEELGDLVDVFESSYMLVQPRPEEVSIKNDRISVSYDARRTVRPLDHSDLFTSFAKLAAYGEPREAKIRRWVERFGLPVRGSRPELEEGVPVGTVPRYKPMSMEVHHFRKEAKYAHDLLDLYLVIRGREASAIKTKVRRMRSRVRSNYGEASRVDREFLDQYRTNQHSLLADSGDRRYRSFRDAFPVSKAAPGIEGIRSRRREFVNAVTVLSAQSALGDILTSLVSNVELRVGVQRGEGLTSSWYCPDLLSAIYLKFYLLVTKSKPIRFCKSPACRQPFIPNSGKHIYCKDGCRSNARNYPVS
jgi:hypothetical protein